MEISNISAEISKAYRDQDEMEWVEVSKAKATPDNPWADTSPWERELETKAFNVNQKRKRKATNALLLGSVAATGGGLVMGARNPALARAGAVTAAGGVGGLGYGAYHGTRKPATSISVSKRSRTWSEEELGRRKNLQGGISAAGSTAGLASLGLLGASLAAKKKPVLVKVSPEKLKDASLTSGIIASGVGGIGGLHFGSVQRQEVRRQKINAAKLSQAANNQKRR